MAAALPIVVGAVATKFVPTLGAGLVGAFGAAGVTISGTLGNVLAGALIGAATSAITGGNPLTGALFGGLGAGIGGMFGGEAAAGAAEGAAGAGAEAAKATVSPTEAIDALSEAPGASLGTSGPAAETVAQTLLEQPPVTVTPQDASGVISRPFTGDELSFFTPEQQALAEQNIAAFGAEAATSSGGLLDEVAGFLGGDADMYGSMIAKGLSSMSRDQAMLDYAEKQSEGSLELERLKQRNKWKGITPEGQPEWLQRLITKRTTGSKVQPYSGYAQAYIRNARTAQMVPSYT